MASKLMKKKHMTFTTMNVLRAVREVKNTNRLGISLGVPASNVREIESQFSSVPQRRKAFAKYFIDNDPVASWRGVIVALDAMGEETVADELRHLAEPITDPTLTIYNLSIVMASIKDWYNLGQSDGGLCIPFAVRNEIRTSTAYQTEKEKKMALLLYYLHNVPTASWQSVAGALYFKEEVTVLQAVKVFLNTPAEPSLTQKNLSTVLDSMNDDLWRVFSDYVNIPRSARQRIWSQYPTDTERKKGAIDSLVSAHPAPSWRLVARALYQMHGCHKALECLQQLFPTGRYRAKLVYEREMIRGHIELDIDKLVMFGIAGSGKTCAVALLLGMMPPEIRCSTPLMKRPIDLMFMDIDKNLQWKMRTSKEIQNTVAEIILSRMKQAGVVSDASPASPGQQPSHTTASQSLRLTPEMTNSTTSEAAGKSTTSSEIKPTGRVPSEAEGSLDSLLQSTNVEEEFVSLINSSPPSSVPIIQLRQIVVLDSGGQPHFHEMMPAFLNGASKFVYVFKVHESLDKRTMIRYFDGHGKLVYEFPASQTNEDTLKQCTLTMSSLTAKNTDIPLPRMLFLATHRDMVADESLPGVLDALHKRLKEFLLPQFKDQLIFCDTKGEDFIFTLNAAKPVKEDQECAEAIRRCLSGEKEGRKIVKVPLRWHALYQKLLQVAEGLGKTVLSREECRLVAESMEIDDESCEETLNFFNGLNMLFYFPHILEHLVFMDPQFLLNKVTELVEESYRMSQGKNQPLRPTEGDKLKFRDYGQVTEKFLNEFNSRYEETLFTPKELITLLKGLLVLADLSEDVYFMPCLLQMVTSEVVAQYRVSGDKALALHFPDSGPLLGMFCCTVAYLLSPENGHPCPWKVVQNEAGTPECLNRNVIQFTIPKVIGTVSLVDHFTHFEIHIHTLPKKAAQLWKLAHDAVFAGLKKVGKTLGYTFSTPVPAIVCPAHPDTPHPAMVDDDAWTCSKMAQNFGDVAEGTIPWLTVCNTHSETQVTSAVATSQPSVTQNYPSQHSLGFDDFLIVKSELRPVAHRWKYIGLALRLAPLALDIIRDKSHVDVEDCLADVLAEWLSKAYNVTRFGEPSWKHLVEAVAHPAGGNDHALAERIAAKYSVPPPSEHFF